jgi:hypothetical protein
MAPTAELIRVLSHWFSISVNIARWTVLGSVVLLFALDTGHATSVAVFWTDNMIVLGTDSKRVVDGNPTTVCKLEHVNDVYFAMDGTFANVNTDYDVRAIARKAMAGEGTIQARFDEFRKQTIAKLPNLVQHERRTQAYQTWISGHDYIVGATFAGVESKKLVLHIMRFGLNPQGQIIELPINVQETIDRKAIGYYPAGFGTCINNACVVDLYDHHGPDVAVERIINAGIALSPEFVGPPVAIVRLENGTPKWIRRPDFCSE